MSPKIKDLRVCPDPLRGAGSLKQSDTTTRTAPAAQRTRASSRGRSFPTSSLGGGGDARCHDTRGQGERRGGIGQGRLARESWDSARIRTYLHTRMNTHTRAHARAHFQFRLADEWRGGGGGARGGIPQITSTSSLFFRFRFRLQFQLRRRQRERKAPSRDVVVLLLHACGT